MFKKIILFLIFYTLLFSCGKKEDPEYKGAKNNILITKV